jgi:hypothetical protein
MHKVSSENRTQSIKRVADWQISDSEMIFKVTSEDFAENALYHSTCIARYFLRSRNLRCQSMKMHSINLFPPSKKTCWYTRKCFTWTTYWRYLYLSSLKICAKLHNVSASAKVGETLWWCYRYSMSTRAGYV